MAVSLSKGQKISLSKEKAGLEKVVVGLGWDAKQEKKGFLSSLFSSESDIDCDATALVCTNGKIANNKDVVYFGNLRHSSGAITHMGDNLTGDGDGDDEQIVVDLKKVPSKCDKIVFVVNIYQAVSRKQHFGMIQNAFIRIVDTKDNQEICKFNLTDNYDNMTAMIFGELVLQDGEWQFNALGEGTKDPGLKELVARFS